MNKHNLLPLYLTPRMLVSMNKQGLLSFASSEDKQVGSVAVNVPKHSGILEGVGLNSACVVPWPTQGHHAP